MNVAVVTMFYNETVNLPIWVKYYGNIFGRDSLYPIDHGSEQDVRDVTAGCNYIRIPRSPFNDPRRAAFISNLQHSLLQMYDYVIYTDCDELLVADPDNFSSLKDYISKMSSDYVTSVGLNIQQVVEREAPYDTRHSILDQRSYCRFVSPMCKTLISKVPLTWGGGFHTTDKPINIDKNLFLFHTRRMDLDVALKRLKITREMSWVSHKAGHHQRVSDDELKHYFLANNKSLIVDSFDFQRDLDKWESQGSEFHSNRLLTIPNKFRGLF